MSRCAPASLVGKYTAQVVAYWLMGRENVEEEQQGRRRLGYGEALLEDITQRLKVDFGSGYSVNNLKFIRQFYTEYPGLMRHRDIGYALRSQSASRLGEGFTQPVQNEQPWSPPLRAHVVSLDDFGPEADLATLSWFTDRSPKRDRHRKFVQQDLPIGLVNTGPGFSEYRGLIWPIT